MALQGADKAPVTRLIRTAGTRVVDMLAQVVHKLVELVCLRHFRDVHTFSEVVFVGDIPDPRNTESVWRKTIEHELQKDVIMLSKWAHSHSAEKRVERASSKTDKKRAQNMLLRIEQLLDDTTAPKRDT